VLVHAGVCRRLVLAEDYSALEDKGNSVVPVQSRFTLLADEAAALKTIMALQDVPVILVATPGRRCAAQLGDDPN